MNEPESNTSADDATIERSWPYTLKLKHRVEFGESALTSLTFRRGRMGDLKGVKPDGIPSFEQLLLIASRMCGEPTAALDRLDAEDGAEVIGVALDFFVKCLRTGPRPSQS